jgi:anhydro-N-acetylmuramic acid kinase
MRYFVGLSSGSSLSGVDAALVRVNGFGADMALKLEYFLTVPFSNELRDWLHRALSQATPEIRHLAMLHRVLGETFALAVRQLLEQCRQVTQQVLCVGCPGQILWHDPTGRYPATLNLGMTSVLAERTGLTTISDFAGRDLALGGQGTLLHALVDGKLFHDLRETRLHLHLGSIASLIYLPKLLGVNARHLVGFEAAPATLLLDGLMRLMTNGREIFDAGGKHAVQGRCLEPLLERWLQNHFFQERPPKSVARHEFGADFLNRAIEQAQKLQGNLHDVLCTMTHFVARSIVHAIRSHLPEMPARILLSGRGVRNGFLWHLLEQQLSPIMLEKTDLHGIPIEACQALANAALAALTMDGVPVNLPSVTGATGQRVLGQITPGASANWERCLAWMARQSAPLQAAA